MSRFWLAKSTRFIHHNQLLITKFGRILCLIIYMKKFLDCDWLREMQFFGNTVQKKGNLVQKRGNKRGILIG